VTRSVKAVRFVFGSFRKRWFRAAETSFAVQNKGQHHSPSFQLPTCHDKIALQFCPDTAREGAMRTREELLSAVRDGRVPQILVIGGGINGVGVFRDLAAQGIPALLVDAGDFSSGTSAAPSRLIHGGLRYLETGEARLVRESLVERNLLLKNAHHLVHPQPIWVPPWQSRASCA